MKRSIAVLAALSVAAVSWSCAKNAQPEASPAASASQATAAPSQGVPGQAQSTSTTGPQPEVTFTGQVDLLTARVGTVLRSWPPSDENQAENIVLGNVGWTSAPGSSGPYVFVYELPGPAMVQEFKVGLGEVQSSSVQTVHLAVSLNSATSGFNDVGTYKLNGQDGDWQISPAARARWIQITVDQVGPSTALYDMSAMGTFDPRPAPASIAGMWLYFEDDPYKTFVNENQPSQGGALPAAQSFAQLASSQNALEIDQNGSQLSGEICGAKSASQTVHGQVSGASVSLSTAEGPLSTAIVNEEGTMLVAAGGEQDWFAMRMTGGGSCAALNGFAARGKGPPVLVVFDQDPSRYAPYQRPQDFPGYSYVPQAINSFDPKALGGYQTVVLTTICNAASVLTKTQEQGLVDWVYSGGKLIIQDADDCTDTDYSFLPYPFTTSNPGKNAAKGPNLVIVESNTLGSTDRKSPDFVDTAAYLADPGQQLGDANVVVTQDRHWCGHFYGTNVLNQNGFEQMYAPFGQGMIIYNGFDSDDNTIPAHDKVKLLELRQDPTAALPCNQLVSTPFTLAAQNGQPLKQFTPGKAATVSVPMMMLASHGFSGAVKLSVQPPPNAPWPSSLSSNAAHLSGGMTNFNLNVAVPANAKPGSYPFVVKASDAAGDVASTTVTLASAGAAPAAAPARAAALPPTPKIAKTLATQKRVAVYGIYFDFDSAKLKPESAPVLKEIADALVANPSWKLLIEGHTDNVGGAAYNLELSKQRAISVKNALVTTYHISAARLSTIGYGFTRPKASNDTPQGRALNRRVELVRT